MSIGKVHECVMVRRTEATHYKLLKQLTGAANEKITYGWAVDGLMQCLCDQ